MKPFLNLDVAAVFDGYDLEFQEPLLELRQLIFEVAERVSSETVTESLKWQQPSYVMKGASPVRIDRFGADKIAIFFHCQTTLVEQFRGLFNETLEFSKNRAIVLEPQKVLPKKELIFCLEMALTYHRKKAQ